jgi:hypothetical protein
MIKQVLELERGRRRKVEVKVKDTWEAAPSIPHRFDRACRILVTERLIDLLKLCILIIITKIAIVKQL